MYIGIYKIGTDRVQAEVVGRDADTTPRAAPAVTRILIVSPLFIIGLPLPTLWYNIYNFIF